MKKDFIRINDRMINLNAVTSIMYSESAGETTIFFDEENYMNITGYHLDFICEALGERVAIYEDEK